MAAKGIVRNFAPLNILTEEQVQQIQRAALDVLETTGVRVESEKARKIYQKGGCKVDHEEKRVKFPPGLVAECLRKCPTSFHMKALDPKNDIIVGGNVTYMSLFAGLRTVDLDTWETKIPTTKDQDDACKIADGLEFVYASTSYTPYSELSDEPPAMMLPVTTCSRLKHFSKISRVGTTMGSHVFEIQMAQALGVDIYGAFECQPPLTWAEDASDCGIACAEAGFPVEPGCAGSMGGSHPATIAGALVTAIAEVMSATVLVQLVRPGNPIIVNAFDFPQNMRTGDFNFGAIGGYLFAAGWNQFWRTTYGIPVMNGTPGPTNSKSIDFQCGYEKALGVLICCLSGANIINYAGGLTAELVYHPVQSVLDNDVAGYVGRFLEGIKIDDETLAIDLIEETGPIPGFYLNKAHTRKWWKMEQFLPYAADMLTYTEWMRTGKQGALELAKERADYLLKSWESKLPPGKEEELNKILEDCRRWYKKTGRI
jgi:trimethylamine--corrinoid protein Co-methyltransferase